MEIPGAIFPKKAGIDYLVLNKLIDCKTYPLDRNGELKRGVSNLCEYLNKMPCELFSTEQLEPLQTNKAYIEVDRAVSGASEPTRQNNWQ